MRYGVRLRRPVRSRLASILGITAPVIVSTPVPEPICSGILLSANVELGAGNQSFQPV